MATGKTAKKPASHPAAPKTAPGAVTVHAESIETAVKAGADAASKGMEKAATLSKGQVEAAARAGAVAFKNYEELLAFGRENVEAIVASSTVVARGVQDISKSFVLLAQESIDDQVAASKALIGAKTLREVVDLSSQYAKSNFDKLVAEGNKLSQISAKLAEEAMAPLSVRVSATMDRITKTAA